MHEPLKEIVIVGGGTAGWLTAGILAAEHKASCQQGVNVTLIESATIPTIGVGEGTWPTMRETLSSIGISESEFIACCDASFKQGSLFVNWRKDTSSERYYHPFVAPHGFGQTNLVDYWSTHHENESFAHLLSSQPHLCDMGKAPKQFQTPAFAAVANYGYHLDAGKFATLLSKHCINKLGVKHIIDDVESVQGAKEANIEALITKESGVIKGDLFIDCSGMQALLINKHYDIPLISQKDILFNDSALAVQVPYDDANAPIASQTISTAHDNGWVWDIGLPTRRGIGCVFASDYLSVDDAHSVLSTYLEGSIAPSKRAELQFRQLTFSPGYREKMWHMNCVAVGMSSGFIEPLEASALALVELSAKMIAKELPNNCNLMPVTAKRYNQRFNYRWQRVIEFLKLHYILSDRTSDYWRDNRNASSVPERLKELMALWQYQPPSFNDFTEIEEVFPAASYQYVLYGMGYKTSPRATTSRQSNELLAEQYIQENKQLIKKYLGGLPSNRELINYLVSQYQQQTS